MASAVGQSPTYFTMRFAWTKAPGVSTTRASGYWPLILRLSVTMLNDKQAYFLTRGRLPGSPGAIGGNGPVSENRSTRDAFCVDGNCPGFTDRERQSGASGALPSRYISLSSAQAGPIATYLIFLTSTGSRPRPSCPSLGGPKECFSLLDRLYAARASTYWRAPSFDLLKRCRASALS